MKYLRICHLSASVSVCTFFGLSESEDRAHSGGGADARGSAVQGLKAPDAGTEIKMLQ